MKDLILSTMEESIRIKRAFFRAQAAAIEEVVRLCVESIMRGSTLFFCGNGGSAADSQHLAAELAGRYLRDRAPLPAIALTTNTSVITAIGNDYGYAEVFSRQLRGFGRRGDILFALSTSGNSENVLRAVRTARDLGIVTVGLLGGRGGKLRGEVDLALVVPSDRPDRVQESHISVGHVICEQIERLLFPAAPSVHVDGAPGGRSHEEVDRDEHIGERLSACGTEDVTLSKAKRRQTIAATLRNEGSHFPWSAHFEITPKETN